jgi:hypothetical protein
MPQLTALDPPTRLRESHRELLSRVGGGDRVAAEGWSESARRAVPWLGRRAELRAELTGLGVPPERPLAPSEQPYAQAIEELFEAGDRGYATVTREGQLLLAGTIRKLRRMRRPDTVAEEHDLLITALTEYAAAERDFSEAVLAVDEARLIEGAERLDVAGGQLDAWRKRTVTAMLG